MSLGIKVRELRLQRGWSQYQLAKRAGISRSSIAAIEGGKYITKTASLLKLAHVFDIPVEELFRAAGFGVEGKVDRHTDTPEEILEKLRLAQPVSIPVYTEFPVHLGGVHERPREYIYWAKTKGVGRNIEAYVAHGHCMEPKIEDGDIVVVDRDLPGEVGDVLLCMMGERIIVGRLVSKPGGLWVANNEREDKVEDCQASAKIIEVIKRLA